jgi:hypothetical protein
MWGIDCAHSQILKMLSAENLHTVLLCQELYYGVFGFLRSAHLMMITPFKYIKRTKNMILPAISHSTSSFIK